MYWTPLWLRLQLQPVNDGLSFTSKQLGRCRSSGHCDTLYGVEMFRDSLKHLQDVYYEITCKQAKNLFAYHVHGSFAGTRPSICLTLLLGRRCQRFPSRFLIHRGGLTRTSPRCYQAHGWLCDHYTLALASVHPPPTQSRIYGPYWTAIVN